MPYNWGEGLRHTTGVRDYAIQLGGGLCHTTRDIVQERLRKVIRKGEPNEYKQISVH